ncbi:DUF3870 domain-containing protein [Desulfofundulus salinus]|jgi:hypothetical protein|uniref:DUF3870 domain-containing protein n=1 Tax=Desulfofundulus salinus TaxID=2419843 RepID=A0A494WYV7_9FIRM|nr:DUF3870 domain-containing protein [Desulfofundulus salinum]MDK2887983.1 hypothetical protein [Thermoanaerobacter sp.]RKO67532.1 DUF3870 domain-containing protein [Desulfofundulus salinum]
MEMEQGYFLVSGFAQTPKGTPVNEMYKHIGAILLIDRTTNCIIKSDFSVVSSLTKEVLQDLIQGFCVNEPFENLANKLKHHINIPSLGAILQAIKSAIDRYKDTALNTKT